MTTAVYSPVDEIPRNEVGAAGRDRVTLLQFVTVFGLGGTERHLVNLSRGLDRSLFDLQLACMNRWGYFLKEFEEQNIKYAGYQVFLYDPVGNKLEFNFVKEFVPDAVPLGTTAGANLR